MRCSLGSSLVFNFFLIPPPPFFFLYHRLFFLIFSVQSQLQFISFFFSFAIMESKNGNPWKRLQKRKQGSSMEKPLDTIESSDLSSSSTSSESSRHMQETKQRPEKRKAAAKKSRSPHGAPKYNVVDAPRFDIDDAKSREAGFEYLRIHGYARWKDVASDEGLKTTKDKFFEFCWK